MALPASADATPTTTTSGRGFVSIADAVAAGRIDPEVVDAVKAGESIDAIVTFEHAADLASAKASTTPDAAGDRQRIDKLRGSFAARKLGVRVRHRDLQVVETFENLPMVHARIASKAALLRLANDADVSSVRANRTLERGAMDAQSAPLVRQPQAAAAGYRGAGAYVAVLDTGIDYRQPDFGSCTAPATPAATCRVPVSYDAAPNDGSLDDNGHGTNVSGIVAGIAPGAGIIGIDVFNGGSSNSSYMLSAMNYLIGQRRNGVNVVAANLSIWTKTWNANGAACADDLGFATARSVGIIPVVISGNGGHTTGASYPGCIPGALTVGAVYDSNVGSMSWGDGNCTDSTTYADKVTCFSQSGPNVKMLAPGSIITAAGISQSGTSQAAPHVAGAVAVLAAAKPGATVTAIESALVNSGPAITDRDGRVRRRLDVYSALSTLLGSTSTDTTAPSVVAPSQTVGLDWGLGATAVPVTIKWSASDASGINAYDLYASTNGGAWTKQTLTTATATSRSFDLTPGSRYQFAVAARDGAGNWSGWSYGPTFRVDNYADNNTAIKYSTGWTRSAWTDAYGGTVTAAAAKNASATFTFTGRGVAWVASKATNRGQAYVYVDGVYQGSWELYSATTRPRTVVMTGNWATSATHTVQIVVVGTTGRPTVDIDSLIVLS
jgi:subtilisin family serine protease